MNKGVLLLALGCVLACNRSDHQISESETATVEDVVANAVSALPLADEASLDKYLKQYAPVDMNYDASGLSPEKKALLKKLVEAAAVVDQLYWVQTSTEGLRYKAALKDADPNSKEGKAYRLLVRNGGPYKNDRYCLCRTPLNFVRHHMPTRRFAS